MLVRIPNRRIPAFTLPPIASAPAPQLAWLGRRDARQIEPALTRHHAPAADPPPLLRDLRSLLARRLDDPSHAAMPHGHALSERSLQRKLSEHGTTFQGEVNAVR